MNVLAGAASLSEPARLDVDGPVVPTSSCPTDGRLVLRRFTAALALDTTYGGDGTVDIARPEGSTDNYNWGGDSTRRRVGHGTRRRWLGTFSLLAPARPVTTELAVIAGAGAAQREPRPAVLERRHHAGTAPSRRDNPDP